MDHPKHLPARAEPGAALLPTLGLLPVIALSAVVAGPALAQEAIELDTIVVEGQTDDPDTSYAVTDGASEKYTAPLLDTPKTVTVITKRVMEERGATSVTEVLRTTPGVTLGAGEGGTPLGDRPYIRGFEASNDILIDGMRNASRTSYEAFNLETVEIAKGPGGAYAGAGGAGGTINLNSKVPQPGSFDDVSLSFGTGAYVRGTLDSNRQFGNLGLRLNVMRQTADDLGGREGVTSDRFGIAPSLSFDLGGGSKVTAGLYYLESDDMPDYGVPMSNANTPDEYRRGNGSRSNPYLPVDVSPDSFYGLKHRDFREVETASGYLRFDHEFSDSLRFSATVRQTRDSNTYVLTSPTSAADGTVSLGSKASDRLNETTAFNAQLGGEGDLFGLKHSFAFGLDLSRNKATTYGITVTNPAGLNVPYGHPDPDMPWGGSIAHSGATGVHTTRATGLYAFDTIELAPQWEASFGLRYDNYKVTSRTYASATDSWTTAHNNSDFVNGTAGLVYKPLPNGSIYLAYSTSSNPSAEGAGTGGSNASDSLDNLDPERTESLELGTKWALFDDQLMLSAAVFQSEKDNARVTNALGETENIGNTRVKGIELGFAGQITDKWGISGGYVYQDARLVDGGYTIPRGGTPDDAVPNPATGKQLTKIPRNSFSMWTTYQATPAVLLGGGVTYIDERMASYSTSGSNAALPESWRTDLMASYTFEEGTVLQLNVNNVFDEQIYTDSHVSQFANIEPGRNFVLSLRRSF